MKRTDFAVLSMASRPSVFVPVLIVAAATLPAFFAGGCGSSSSSSSDTSQYTSLPTNSVILTLDWPILSVAPPTPNPTPSATPSATPTPSASATPIYTLASPAPTPGGGIQVPLYTLSAVLTLSSADPNNGSVLIFPPVNRDPDKPFAYSETYTYALKARVGTTNANVRFYDSQNGYGNVLGDSTKLAVKINADGTGLNAALPNPTPTPTPTPTPSPSVSASP